MSKKIFILAGEVSGDLHGAALIEKLKALSPDLQVYGIGGEAMIKAGLQPLYKIDDLAFLGFSEVIKHLPKIFEIRKSILEFIEKEKIRTVVLIDYPGFNLNIARKLKENGVKVLYYISPQLWAWGSSRAKKMKKRIDKLFVVFPFEVDFFAKYGIDAEFVGHPLIERIDKYDFIPQDEFFRVNELSAEKEILLLMSGSRKHEVEMILPEAYSAAKKLAEKHNLQIVISASPNIDASFYRKYSGDDVKIISGKTYELMRYSKFGLIKSGTSTLEAGLLGLPFVVLYRTGALTYLLGKALVNIDSIALVNIVAGKKIVKELIQKDATADKIFSVANELLNDKAELEKMKNEFSVLREKLSNEKNKRDLAKRILEELV